MNFQIFRIDDDVEKEIVEVSKPIKPFNSNNCYIFVDNINLNIYIYLGSKIAVRSKFIAARHAQHLRQQLGLVHKVKTVEEGTNNSEFSTFLAETNMVEGTKKPKINIKRKTISSTVSPSTIKTVQDHLLKKHHKTTSPQYQTQKTHTQGLVTPQVSNQTSSQANTVTNAVNSQHSKPSLKEISNRVEKSKLQRSALTITIASFEQVKTRKLKKSLVPSLTTQLVQENKNTPLKLAKNILKTIIKDLLQNEFLSETEKCYKKSTKWSKSLILERLAK